MPSERQSAESIFHVAVEISSTDQRRNFLNDACADAPEMRKQVDALLRAYYMCGSFLEHPDGIIGAKSSDTSANASDALTQPPEQNPRADSRTLAPDGPPRFFGDYELLAEIAHGAMGKVYKARQVSLNRIVAIKMILAGQFASESDVQRFYTEAEAAANIDHPGIVPVFDIGSHQGQHYFAMAFVDGESLSNKMANGPLPPRAAAQYVKKIAAAMHVAHEHGIVHRDLKPGNILINQSGEPRVTDFGLAKKIEAESDLTSTGMIIGTPCYMPPEQAGGKVDQITAKSDVYSLGAILYALLTGRPPFDGKNPMETLMHVLQEEPTAPRKLVSKIPKDLEAICLKCLDKAPGRRYHSAEELAEDLQQFLSGEPIKAKNDLVRRLRQWTLNQPVLAAHLLAILLMMAMVAVNYLLFGRNNDNSFRLLVLNQVILGAWGVVSILLQKTHNLLANKNVIPIVWGIVNPVLLTATLGANEAPRGPLLSLYTLLIIATCFFRRVELVAITTAASLIGFVTLTAVMPEREPAVTPASYLFIYGLTLTVAGILLGFLAVRLKRLGQNNAK